MGVNLRLAVFTQHCVTVLAIGTRPEPTPFSSASPAPHFPFKGKAGTALKSQESQPQSHDRPRISTENTPPHSMDATIWAVL